MSVRIKTITLPLPLLKKNHHFAAGPMSLFGKFLYLGLHLVIFAIFAHFSFCYNFQFKSQNMVYSRTFS